MVMTLKPRDARHYTPKTTWSRSLTSSDEFTRRYYSHQCPARPQKKIAVYFWIFKSSTKFRFQRIKNEVNRSFPQEVMAKTSKVVHSEIFWTARSAKSETGITPSFGLRLKRMTTCWKEEAGATWWEQDREDDDDNNEGELGRCFHQAYMIKFRGLEHRKNPNDIGKWRHKRSTFDKRRCCKQTTTDYKSATINTWRCEKQTTKSASRWHLAQSTTTPLCMKKLRG